MASLINRRGNYYAEFYDANRTPYAKRFSLRTTRKTDARRKLAELERDFESGHFDPWIDDPRTYKDGGKPKPEKPFTLGEALDAFLNEKETQGCARSTLVNYRCFCGGLVRTVGSEKPLVSLRKQHVEAFVQDDSVSKESRRTRFRHVRAWLRWCEQKGYVRTAATANVATPPKAEKLPKAIREADLHAIEAAIRADYADKLQRGEVMEGEVVWMIPLLWFGLYSGLRSSELARLRWGHIDFENDLIYIFEQKNGKEQTVPLTLPARRILANLTPDDPEAYVFRSPNCDPYQRSTDSFKWNLARKFKRYRLAAGIQRRITVHGLRHGFCTILAEAGKSAPIIKEAARHADIATSMRYVHIANEKLKAELNSVFR